MRKLKCVRFDLEDPEIMYALYKVESEWTHAKSIFDHTPVTTTLYKKVKSFKSKPELDMWCALSNFEYKFADRLKIKK